VRSFCRKKCQKAARSGRATGAPVHTTDRRTTNTKDSNPRRAPTGAQVSPSIPIPPISRRNQHIVLPRARPALVWPDDLIPTTGLWSFRRDNFLPPPEEENGRRNSLPADGTWAFFGSPGRNPQKDQEEGPTSADVQMEQNHDCSTASSTASSAALFSDLRRLTEAPDWLQNNQPRVFRHSHWHTSLTTRKPTLGKMVSSTYIRKTPRPPFTQVVSSTTSSSSALASLSRPSAGSSRTTIDISGEDRDRNRNRKQEQDDHDSYDDNEVAVESCSPNLGFAKMEFIANRIGPVRQSPSYPGCPSPPRQISQSLIDEVAAANHDIYAYPSGLRYAREQNTRAMKQKRPQRDNHFSVPELDESPNRETMELSGWNKYNEDEASSLNELSPSGLGFAQNNHPSERFWSSGRDDHSHPHAHYLDASPAEELSVGSEEFDNNDEEEDGDILDLTTQAVAPSPSMAQSRPVQGTGPVQASSFHTEDLYHPRPYARRVDDSVIERLTAAAEAYEEYGGYSSVETHLRNCRFAEEIKYNSRGAEPAGIRLSRSESHLPENPEKLLSRSLIEAMEAAAEY
jgi:hypothetical protein